MPSGEKAPQVMAPVLQMNCRSSAGRELPAVGATEGGGEDEVPVGQLPEGCGLAGGGLAAGRVAEDGVAENRVAEESGAGGLRDGIGHNAKPAAPDTSWKEWWAASGRRRPERSVNPRPAGSSRARLHVPQRGEKKALLEMVSKNAG